MNVTKTTHFGIQRKIVANMTSESWKTVPHISYIYEPDVTVFVDKVKEINSSGKMPYKVTINTVMLKVLAEGLKAAPALNAHIDFNSKLVRGRIDELDEIHANMTWVLPHGEMMTINLHNIGDMSLKQLTEYIAETQRKIGNTNFDEVMFSISLSDTLRNLKKGKIKQAVCRLIGSKTGKHKVKTLSGQAKKDYYSIPEKDRLTKEDIRQGTVTFSNIGSTTRGIPGRVALLAIVPPQIFVACMGAIQKIPMVKADESGNDVIVPGMMMPIDLVFDHRALDFGDLVPFINKLEDIFNNPDQIYNW